MKEIINFVGLIILIWLFVDGAAPVQWIKKVLLVDNVSKTENVFLLMIIKLINCSLCSGMYFGFIYYWNGSIINSLIMGSITGFMAELFHRGIKKVL